jgi:SPP1 family predicted phage head-tail adaptor
MAVIPSGHMRHRIRIEQDSGTTRNAVGEHVQNWAEYATAWGKIEKLKGDEVILAGQRTPNSTHKITMHYQAGIDSKMRVKATLTAGTTHTFGIDDVENLDFANHTLVLTVSENA